MFEFERLTSTGEAGLESLEYVFKNVDNEKISVGYDLKNDFCIKSFSLSLRGKISAELKTELFTKALEIEEE